METNSTAKLPSPKPALLLGHALHFLKGEGGCTYDAFVKIAKDFGDYVELKVPGIKFVVISDPVVLKEMLVERPDDFPKGDTINEMKAIGLASTGLTEVEGEEWKWQRPVLMHLYKAVRNNGRIPDLNASALKAVQSLQKHGEIELSNFMSSIVLHIIVKTTFGAESPCLDDLTKLDPFLVRQQGATEILLRRMRKGPWYKYMPVPDNFRLKKGLGEQKAAFEEFLQMQEKDPEKYKDTILGQMLAAYKEKGRVPDREHIYDQMQTFQGAGLESVGFGLHWLFYYLTQHPEIEQEIYNEVTQVLGDSETVELEHMKSMPLLRSAISETLRLRPPFPMIFRQAAKDDSLGKASFKKGTWIIALLERMQTRSDVWGKDAEEFNPKRFQNGEPPEACRYAYAPYSLGPRVCLGMRAADLQFMVIAAQMIRNFRFELKDGQNVRPFLTFSWGSKSGIWVKVKPRAAKSAQNHRAS